MSYRAGRILCLLAIASFALSGCCCTSDTTNGEPPGLGPIPGPGLGPEAPPDQPHDGNGTGGNKSGPGGILKFRGFGISNNLSVPINVQIMTVGNTWSAPHGPAQRDDSANPALHTHIWFPAAEYSVSTQYADSVWSGATGDFLWMDPSGGPYLEYRPTEITFRYQPVYVDGPGPWKNVTIRINHGCAGSSCDDAWCFKEIHVEVNGGTGGSMVAWAMEANGVTHKTQWYYRLNPNFPPPTSFDAHCGLTLSNCPGVDYATIILQ